MRKILILFFCLPLLGMAQKTYMPDDDFEWYIESLGYGDGIAYNDSVLTASIDTILTLDINYSTIENIKGIEDFISLEHLLCTGSYVENFILDNPNLITFIMNNSFSNIDSVILNCPKLEVYYAHSSSIYNINVDGCPLLKEVYLSHSTFFTHINFQNNLELEMLNLEDSDIQFLDCSNLSNLEYIVALSCSDLASVNLTGCTALEIVYVTGGSFTILDLTTNTSLSIIECDGNYIEHLDVSNCLQLNRFICSDNNLSTLNMTNINLTNIWSFDPTSNPELTCIEVNDTALANYEWKAIYGDIDTQHYFSLNCGWDPVIIEEENSLSTNRYLISIVDILGRESKPTPNVPLFYRYDDGTVEKKLIIE